MTQSSFGASPTKSSFKFAYCFRRVSLHVCPHVTTRETLNWFSWNLIPGNYIKNSEFSSDSESNRGCVTTSTFNAMLKQPSDASALCNDRYFGSCSRGTGTNKYIFHVPTRSSCDQYNHRRERFRSHAKAFGPTIFLLPVMSHRNLISANASVLLLPVHHLPCIRRSTNCPAAVSLFHCFSTLIQNLIYFWDWCRWENQ